MDDQDIKSQRQKMEDAKLWKHMTQDVKALPGMSYDQIEYEFAELHQPIKPSKNIRQRPTNMEQTTKKSDGECPPLSPSSKSLDRKTERRLRQGRLTITARLDLHGLTQIDAHEALNQFLNRCYHEDKRCVLVITGKGHRHRQKSESYKPNQSVGILKKRLPEWVSEGHLGRIVLSYASAQLKDGGDGAYYILLRRKRR